MTPRIIRTRACRQLQFWSRVLETREAMVDLHGGAIDIKLIEARFHTG